MFDPWNMCNRYEYCIIYRSKVSVKVEDWGHTHTDRQTDLKQYQKQYDPLLAPAA